MKGLETPEYEGSNAIRDALDERGIKWHGGSGYNGADTTWDVGDVAVDTDESPLGSMRMMLEGLDAEQVMVILDLLEGRLVSKDDAPGDTSDGYHTFDELYEHRTGILAALCNVSATLLDELGGHDLVDYVFKSRRHHDGDMYDGMFIVGIRGEGRGWSTWHCEDEWWDKFAVPELDRAPEWDGHTPQDALDRLVESFCSTEGEDDDR